MKGDRIWKYVLEIGKEYVLVIRNIRNMELFVVLGVLSIIILLTLCIVSGHAKGRAGMEIGALGLATMVLSIIGFVLAVRCNKEEDIYHVTPAVGSVLNGIMILLFMVLFIKGAI